MRRPGDWIQHHAPVMRVRVLREGAPVVRTQQDEPPPRRYAYELTARPLVLPPGVTELAASYQRRSFVTTTRNEDGAALMTGRVSRGTPDLSLAHAFSRAELGIGIGQLAYGWVAIDTRGFPERVQFGIAFSAPQPDSSYAHQQSLTARHKLASDTNFALVAAAGLTLFEVNGYTREDERGSGEFLATSAGLTLEVQLHSRIAMSFGFAASVPLAKSGVVDAETNTGASTGILAAFDTWDLVITGAIARPTEDPATYIAGGFRKRWGL